ncbi:histidine phosphatase family protein [Paenibacillus protaetiae]|uniref:Histidine phosphatase family protein n=1 Tax=Paenibacillus protaetiae TaxID=2509456 RepID=A0A4P6EUK0_9BACL|nr:histidine phosphatase family protein [Paenibacillus protaetiae]QAY65319.1 histidine phosphatase family protein [Paenibacillus protaetiae]
MTHITLVRHGITAWNKEGRAQGHTNNPLDEEGFRQAEAVAARLGAEHWDAVYSSDLLRARQTAETIAARAGNPPLYLDQRLREMGGGLIEGTTMAERIERFGHDWREKKLGIETKTSGMDRGGEVLEEIAAKHPDGRILVVSHGAIIRHALMKLLPDLNVDELLGNTAVTRIRKTAEGWQCDLYNCTDHLNER